MAAEPLTTEAIALTEKKMDMALDDIIKMSKNATNKGKKQHRAPNKSQKFNGGKTNALKVKQYMDSRSAVRQGALAKRRSNFQGNQFSLTNEVAQNAASARIRSRAFNSGRVANANKSRPGAQPIQKRAANAGYVAKGQQNHDSQRSENRGIKMQKPRTLDSLFANMKERRMTVVSHGKNNVRGNGGANRGRAPWFRGHFGN